MFDIFDLVKKIKEEQAKIPVVERSKSKKLSTNKKRETVFNDVQKKTLGGMFIRQPDSYKE